MPAIYLGVDIAKSSFVAAIWRGDSAQRLGEFPNTPEGFRQWVGAVARAAQAPLEEGVHLVLEPTGGYELPLALFAYERGFQVSLPNPKQLRDWAHGLGQRAKTDTQDALLLARFAAERKPLPWRPLAAEVSELESLLERRRDLEQMLQQERNRQQAVTGRPGVAARVPASVQEVIEALEGALKKVEEAIQGHLKQHQSLRQQAKRLRTVPGVGERNVLPLLVLLCRFATLTGERGEAKQLVAYAGLDPTTHESGTSVRGRRTISRRGNRAIRPLLYMGALGGIGGKNALRAFYERLVGRGKAKKLALIACARKILVWAWAVHRDQTAFRQQPAEAAVA
jgi:transposase